MTTQGHALARSTHTMELAQVAELAAKIAASSASDAPISAEAIGLTDATASALGPLRRVVVSGPPSFPYVFGVFAEPGSGTEVSLQLHTEQLRAVSRLLHLRHHWGL